MSFNPIPHSEEEEMHGHMTMLFNVVKRVRKILSEAKPHKNTCIRKYPYNCMFTASLKTKGTSLGVLGEHI